MWKLLTLAVILGLAQACSQYGAIHKTHDEFIRLCDSVTAKAKAAGTNETDTANLKQRLIAPGMQITVNVAEDATLKRTYIVPPGCALDIAAAGRMEVCGLTTEELAAKIRVPLERDFFQQANVTVFIESATNPDRPGGVVYLIGDVNRPGPLLLPAEQVFTLTKAIIAAGGFSQFAKSSAVRVLRYCEDGKKYDTFVNVERIMQKGEFELDIPLQPNDWVIVTQKIISF